MCFLSFISFLRRRPRPDGLKYRTEKRIVDILKPAQRLGETRSQRSKHFPSVTVRLEYLKNTLKILKYAYFINLVTDLILFSTCPYFISTRRPGDLVYSFRVSPFPPSLRRQTRTRQGCPPEDVVREIEKGRCDPSEPFHGYNIVHRYSRCVFLFCTFPCPSSLCLTSHSSLYHQSFPEELSTINSFLNSSTLPFTDVPLVRSVSLVIHVPWTPSLYGSHTLLGVPLATSPCLSRFPFLCPHSLPGHSVALPKTQMRPTLPSVPL